MRLLVLPIAGEEGRDGLARAALLTRELCRRFGTEAGVRVVSGGLLPRLGEGAVDPRRLGQDLEAAFVLSGELHPLGERRVAARFELLEVATGAVLWNRSFERDAAGLVAFAGEVARQGGAAIGAATAPAGRPPASPN